MRVSLCTTLSYTTGSEQFWLSSFSASKYHHSWDAVYWRDGKTPDNSSSSMAILARRTTETNLSLIFNIYFWFKISNKEHIYFWFKISSIWFKLKPISKDVFKLLCHKTVDMCNYSAKPFLHFCHLVNTVLQYIITAVHHAEQTCIVIACCLLFQLNAVMRNT